MSADQERAALVPCPLCGGDKGYKLDEGSTHRWWSVKCADCGQEVAEARAEYPAETTPRTKRADEMWNEAGKHAQGLRDQIARQASELADLRMKLDTAYAVVIDLGGEVREPEIEEQRRLRADAGRYRWIRDAAPASVVLGFDVEPPYGATWTAAEMDAAIDAAKEQQA